MLHFSKLLLGISLTATTVASAQFLDGCWRNTRNQYLPCHIQQYGQRIIFTNENGSSSDGALYGNSVVAYQWGQFGNLRGQILDGGNRIWWEGNGEWVRDFNCY